LFFGVVVALVHLTNKVEGFGFVKDDDVDVLAYLLLFVELMAKGDDVGGRGDPPLKDKSGSGKMNFNCRSNKFLSITMNCLN
jgi:hypothetical protein